MKNFNAALAAAAIALAGFNAAAEGYQVNCFSARQEGMGHTGVALKLGAESTIFNPGALVFSDKTMEISAGMSGIMSYGKATLPDGSVYKTDDKTSTPFNFSAAFRVYDRLYAGLTLFIPYGSSINWGKNWPGAVLTQNVDLKTFTLQPTLSFKLLPNLSIGAGLMLSWGNVNLNKGLVNANSMDMLLRASNPNIPQAALFNGVTPASVNLTGSSKPVVGINIGAYWQIDSKWAVGVDFRSKQTLSVEKGNAEVIYANSLAEQQLTSSLELINAGNFAASMPMPNVFTFGLSYKPIKRLTLAADFQFTGWSCYRWLDFTFDLPTDLFNQHIYKGYRNSWTYHVGGEFAMTPRLDLRAGMMIDTTPCRRENYNPETPGMTKIEPTVGLSFRPVKGLSIDLACMFVLGCGMDNATGLYDDFIAKQFPQLPLKQPGEFKADYALHAFAPAIGLSYSF